MYVGATLIEKMYVLANKQEIPTIYSYAKKALFSAIFNILELVVRSTFFEQELFSRNRIEYFVVVCVRDELLGIADGGYFGDAKVKTYEVFNSLNGMSYITNSMERHDKVNLFRGVERVKHISYGSLLVEVNILH